MMKTMVRKKLKMASVTRGFVTEVKTTNAPTKRLVRAMDSNLITHHRPRFKHTYTYTYTQTIHNTCIQKHTNLGVMITVICDLITQ